MARILDRTYAAIEELKCASSADAVCSCLTIFMSQFGRTSMISGTMPSQREKGVAQSQHILAWSYPQSWMNRYLEKDYVHLDPVIRRIQSDLSPFTWSEAVGFCQPDQTDAIAALVSEAADHKLCAGVAIPMLTLDGAIAAVSLGGERIEMPPAALGMISLLSSFAIARAIELNSKGVERVKAQLTPREIEYFRWAADGESEWEISAILSISEHTADKHLSNARHKLRAATRTQAVAHAIRLGLIL